MTTVINETTNKAESLKVDADGNLKVTVEAGSTGGLTDAELRASAVEVSVASLPLPSGAATEATLAAVLAHTAASALTDRSGSITTGGVAQELMAANATRRGWYIQNNSDTVMWVSDVGTAAATQPSLKLLPDAYYEPPASGIDSGAISIFCATTGKTFTAREW